MFDGQKSTLHLPPADVATLPTTIVLSLPVALNDCNCPLVDVDASIPISNLPVESMRTFSSGAPFAAFATLNVIAASSVDTLTGHLSLPLALV